MRNMILSRAGDFGSETPRIVQDNARSFASSLQGQNGKREKCTRRISQKMGSPRSIRDVAHFRWKSQDDLLRKETFPLHAAASTHRYPRERWSNGMVNSIKEPMQTEDRSSKNLFLKKNLKASLARDLNIPRKTLRNNILPVQSDQEPRKRSSSLNTMHSSPQHYLICPERVPSSECFWGSKEHPPRLVQSQPTVLEGNSRWESLPKPIPPKTPGT